ncbi:hypothetical protein ACFOEE_11190 [Pseudoalteromonas fenneropenaei]|uniref:DUF2939 domain-containing protein n=1 Tax=Pseudoalteromonas fenneropenaei TaxID=1737459 RepID=A0ABV7CKC7_9GAMM
MNYMNKYKYYISIALTLIFFAYITEPLQELKVELDGELDMQTKRLLKVENLLENKNQVEEQLSSIIQLDEKLQSYLFKVKSEGQLKLEVQQKIDNLLKEANCQIDSLNWLDKLVLNNKVNQWQVKLEFKGPSVCAIKLMRLLENSTPIMRISYYAIGGQDWTGKASEELLGEITVKVWQFEEAI